MMAKSSAFGLERSLIHMLTVDGQRAQPTIRPTPGFSASADAERVHRAMKGLGTDEATLINVLARRTNYERQEIRNTYDSMYKKTLWDAIRGDTCGDFRRVLCELILDTPYLLAKSLYHAMKGLGTKERVLIEILSTLSNDEMRSVSKAYMEVLKDEGVDDDKRSLLTDIRNDTSGDFEYALLCLVKAERDEIPTLQLKAIPEKGVQTVVNEELSVADAKELHTCGVGRVGTNEKRITRVICNRTSFQLKATVETYARLFGRSLIDDLKAETSGDYKKLLVAVLRYAVDRSNLLAEWVHDSMDGAGTKDHSLMRLLITRSEIDLEDVKQAYERNYGKSLSEAVKGDTSGDYCKTLLALIGDQL